MKKKEKGAFIPPDRQETVRQQIRSILKGQTLSIREISGAARVSEREVLDNLLYIQKTVSRQKEPLIVTPAECKKCGFVFRKREKLRKPGKCPLCNSESIREPLFSIGS